MPISGQALVAQLFKAACTVSAMANEARGCGCFEEL